MYTQYLSLMKGILAVQILISFATRLMMATHATNKKKVRHFDAANFA